MPKYRYRARTADGRVANGILRAANLEQAQALLRSHQLLPIELKSAEEAGWQKNLFNGGGISTKELILFCRQISSMIRAGVPILEALRALATQVVRARFHNLLQEIAYDVEGGESLSNAMSKHPHIFSPFFLGMIRTGEVSGRLSQVLTSLADYLEQNYLFMRKVRAALLYPTFVIAVVIILSIIMFTFVLPQLVVLFTDAGVRLPWPTRVLIAITVFFQHYWYIVLGLTVALGFLIRSYLKTAEGQYTWSSYVLRFPVIKQLFQKIYLSRLTSILHTLFESDVPALESLRLAEDAVGNRVYQRILDNTVKAIKDGASISSSWEHELYIPPMLTSMVGVGERSGEVSKAFAEAHRFFSRDVEEMLGSITVLLEPILVIILGLGVGIIVAAVLLPIYNLVLVF